MAKATASQSKPLRGIIIFGNDASTKSLLEKIEPFIGEMCVIGDGKKNLTTEEITSAIKELTQQDRIGPHTQIHIIAHGGSGRVHKNKLSLWLDKSDPIPSENLFKIFTKQTNNTPLNVFIHSCYAGKGKEEFKHLPKGSTLMTYTDPEKANFFHVFDEIVPKALLTEVEGFDPITNFVHSLCTDRSPFASFGINLATHASRDAFSSRAQIKVYSKDEIMRLQRFNIAQFIKYCDGISEGFTKEQSEKFESLKKL